MVSALAARERYGMCDRRRLNAWPERRRAAEPAAFPGCRIPFIFVTAFNDNVVRARAMKAGAICFLSKPVDGQALIDCLDKALMLPK